MKIQRRALARPPKDTKTPYDIKGAYSRARWDAPRGEAARALTGASPSVATAQLSTAGPPSKKHNLGGLRFLPLQNAAPHH